MKQTAVEWLVEQVEQISNNKNLSKQESIDLYNKAIEQAKAMEKEQISDGWYAGDEDGPIHDFEDYYQETFKNK